MQYNALRRCGKFKVKIKVIKNFEIKTYETIKFRKNRFYDVYYSKNGRIILDNSCDVSFDFALTYLHRPTLMLLKLQGTK